MPDIKEQPDRKELPDMTLALSSISAEKNWYQKVLIGSLFLFVSSAIVHVNNLFLPLAVILNGVASGYLLRVMRSSMKGDYQTLPEWNQWLDLMISGVSWMAICLSFTFCGMSLALGLALWGLGQHSVNVLSDQFSTWGLTSFLSLYTYLIFASAFTSILMANFAEEEKMLAGFAWRKVLARIAKHPVLLISAWLSGWTLTFLASTIPFLTVVLSLLAPFLTFMSQVIAARLMGTAWALTAETSE